MYNNLQNKQSLPADFDRNLETTSKSKKNQSKHGSPTPDSHIYTHSHV